MLIHGFRVTHRQMGGSAIFCYPANLLTVRLGFYGSAIETIHLIFYLRWPVRHPSPARQQMLDEFHEFLNQLPKVRFSRRSKRVDIQFVSQKFTAEDDVGWEPTVDKCNRAMSEVLEALTLLKKSVKRTDDFDTARFLSDAAAVLATPIDSQEQWLEIRQQATAIELALRAAQDEWESLEIDWDLYHQDARSILDDPFYWDTANDRAPHGNDTGADLLEDFRRWEKRHKDWPPLKFLERELESWGVSAIDWSAEDPAQVRKLQVEDWPALTLCNEAAIALAFALLKMRGQCPPEILRMALSAIRRRAIIVRESDLGDQAKADWDAALTKMQTKLESLLAVS